MWPRAVLSRKARELARKSFRITVLIAVDFKLIQKIRAKHCKSSESSVYIVVAVYSAHAFPEDCLRLDSPPASKTALERHISLKYDACMRYLSNQSGADTGGVLWVLMNPPLEKYT